MNPSPKGSTRSQAARTLCPAVLWVELGIKSGSELGFSLELVPMCDQHPGSVCEPGPNLICY